MFFITILMSATLTPPITPLQVKLDVFFGFGIQPYFEPTWTDIEKLPQDDTIWSNKNS